MSSRDWDKELAMIDRQLASLSDDRLTAPASAAPGDGPAAVPGAPSATRAATSGTAAPLGRGPVPTGAVGPVVVQASPPRSWRARLAVTGSLVAAGALAALATPGLWPYGWRCGVELAVYLAAAGAALLGGLVAARASWRHRDGLAHVLALVVVLWAVGLVAWQGLPRTGLALPTIDRPAVWACG